MIRSGPLALCGFFRRNTDNIASGGVLSATYSPVFVASFSGSVSQSGTLNAVYSPNYTAAFAGFSGRIGSLAATYDPGLTASISGSTAAVWVIEEGNGSANINAAPAAPTAPLATAGDAQVTLN